MSMAIQRIVDEAVANSHDPEKAGVLLKAAEILAYMERTSVIRRK